MPARIILAAALSLSVIAACAGDEPTGTPELTRAVETSRPTSAPDSVPTAPPTDAPQPVETDEPPATSARPSEPPPPAPTASASGTGGPSPAATTAAQPPAVGLAPFVQAEGGLTVLTHAGDGSGLLYLVEQRGVIRVVSADGQAQATPFLDISERVSAGGERGLLGLAFHPSFVENRRFFVNYTDRDGDTVVAELRAGAQAGQPADPASERVLLRIEQPFPNHNGGAVVFGPDGMLYVSTGDGGGGGDPLAAGQDLSTLLGKLLRIDVDAAAGDEPYAIPADNPFAGQPGARPEIWAYGLRNPWRISFDRATGGLFIADVGQNRWEEVNAEPAGEGGRNYGWSTTEGPECFDAAECDTSGLTPPVAWYPTGSDCAVSGGHVYRGGSIAGLAGYYLYADYCSGRLWALRADDALGASRLPVEVFELGNAGINVTGFGEDEAGELYLVGAGGEVLRLVAAD